LQAALNVDAKVTLLEFNVLNAEWPAGKLHGMRLTSWTDYPDPISFLSFVFIDRSPWHDRESEAPLKEANATLDPAHRMKRLAQCESLLLEAMPVIPLTFSRNLYLAKPYLRAFVTDQFVNISFRYAWIDHGWKP
jgi:ABC-type oligopeptide transport system substrate-binding subunit